MNDQVKDAYDVVVIGGGAAGLNGALQLARSRRSVLVVDAEQQRNRLAQAVHGLLGHDGVTPNLVLFCWGGGRGRDEVRGYGGQVVTSEVAAVRGDLDSGFTVIVAGGRAVRARRLLVTSGLVHDLPDIPGPRARGGRGGAPRPA